MDFPLSPGDLVGDYLVEELIGEGGMALVARAQHRVYQHRVAIKILLPGVAKSKEVVKRFEREQRTLQQLRSEHCVRIYSTGVHQRLPYMVLELLEGKDLAELLKTKGPLETDLAVLYLLQACHAVAEAHSRGIVHRDLKPANLFLTRRHDGSPCVKVLDFGISKVSEPHGAQGEVSLTQTRAVMGSPHYMSPEQMLSARDADTRSDIWAMGVILYELLTCSLPFAARDTEAVCQRILHDKPTPLRKLRPMMSGSLEAALMRCLRRSPRERYANIADLAQRLADFGPSHSREGLASIYRLVPPTQRGPQHTIPAEEARAPYAKPEQDDTTLYLEGSSTNRSGLGWLSAVLAAATFVLGAGMGWVMTLETDPTAGAAQSGIDPGAERPQAAQAATKNDAVEEPEEDTRVAQTDEPIDLDEDEAEEPAKPPPKALPRPVAAPKPAPPPAPGPPPSQPAPPKPAPPVTPPPDTGDVTFD